MNDRGRNTGDERADDLAALFGRIGARERPRPAAEAAAFAALHAEWLGRVAARRRRRLLTLATAAASLAAVASFAYLWLQPPDASASATLATIEHVEGPDITWRDDRSQAQPLGALRAFGEGQRLATGQKSRVALRWHDGGSLRLDEGSRLEFVSAGAVRLMAGNLYFDSATSSHADDDSEPKLAVQTPAGEVVHVGTQFLVRVAGDAVVLSVREGQVKVTGDGFEIVIDADEELDLRADGTRGVTAIHGYDDRWNWAADVAPRIELDGRTTFEVTAWAARETGRRVVYASPAAESSARGHTLRGVDRQSPTGILTLLPHLTELGYEIRDDMIVVSAP